MTPVSCWQSRCDRARQWSGSGERIHHVVEGANSFDDNMATLEVDIRAALSGVRIEKRQVWGD